MKINFNDLPSDIKSKIYKINKNEEQKEFYKKQYDKVIDEIEYVVGDIPYYFNILNFIGSAFKEEDICFFFIYYIKQRYLN